MQVRQQVSSILAPDLPTIGQDSQIRLARSEHPELQLEGNRPI